eukprot:TRINITY_DN1786_c0_g1_i7.p1 TRINITY_DN1786_c0_g1~~TRINITY_DN1786_c0_g1_i7.p1  ORF type:complete len:500 (+),score=61.08 TRINITY_DN1786_c0_g1_i7:77-1501(+)
MEKLAMPILFFTPLLWTACLSEDGPTSALQETVAPAATAEEQCLSLRQLRGQLLQADDREFHEDQIMDHATEVSRRQNGTSGVHKGMVSHEAIEDVSITGTVIGSCKTYLCGTFAKDRSCQCNDRCTRYKNCCADYVEQCASHESNRMVAPAHLPYGHPSLKNYPRHNGFTLWLVEDFDQPIDLDNDPIWTWSDGGLKEGQVRFTKEQISFNGGKMQIRVQKNTGSQQPCSHAQTEIVPRKPLVSGELRTRYNMFRYGRYEVRMRAPHVQFLKPQVDGNFVASMFVFRAASFRHWREVDVEVTGRRAGAISTNVLNADHTSRWHRWIEQTDYPKTYPGINVRAEFHTYAFEWLPGVIRWYIDGRKVREKRNDNLKVPEMSAKVMLNLWIYRPTKYPFGGFELKNDRFPMQSEYDWFRFYRWNGDMHYPPSDMDPKGLSKDDLYLTSNNPCDGIPQVGLVEKNGRQYPACYAKCR